MKLSAIIFLALTFARGPQASAETLGKAGRFGGITIRWLIPMQRQSEVLHQKGLRVRFNIEPDQGHGIQTLAGEGARRLFEQIEEAARGCR